MSFESMQTSFIELSQSALDKNLVFLKNQFKNTKISSVVKANAYGHGLPEFLKMAGNCGIDHFSVFSSCEAQTVLKNLTFPADIMIMGWINEEDIDWILKNEIEFFVFDFERLNRFIVASKRLNITAKVHIEIETGMNRTGFPQKELPELVRKLKKHKNNIQIKGICTHFAGAESIANYYRIKQQIHTFKQNYKFFKKNQLTPERRHTACSAAALSFPETQYEMVRIGIFQYGFWPSIETMIQFITKKKIAIDPLKHVLSWKSSVMSIKEVQRGEFISYGTSYLAQKDMKIAIVPVGYAHGYARSLSNQGKVLLKGNLVDVVGMVNMNMLIVDATEAEDVSLGDEVVLIGNQGELSISVASFSDFTDQLNYELLTRLPAEIPRKITK